LIAKLIDEFKNNWIGFITPILLILISLKQIYLYNYDYLNRWKGGGFGMFSTIHERYFHIHLINNGALECALPHYELHNKLESIRNYPQYLKLEQLTRLMTKKTWVYSYKTDSQKATSVRMIGSKENLSADDKIANFNSIELQVFDIVFNKTTFVVKPKLLRKIEFLK